MSQSEGASTLPASRKEAMAAGVDRYFTGRPCKNGHLSERYVLGTCIACDRERSSARRKTDACREYFREYNRRRYQEDPEKGRDKVRRRRSANLEKAKERERAGYIRNKEARSIRRKAWRARNPEKVVAQNNRRRARIKSIGGSYTSNDVHEMLQRQKYKCAECKKTIRQHRQRHVDHIMPLALGGSNNPDNIQILCVTCNLKKGSAHPIEWARRLGRLV